ncbi:hypothetical protein [Coleofasciculus sp. E2-BRE-01]
MDYPLIFYPIDKAGKVWGDGEAAGAGEVGRVGGVGGVGGAEGAGGGK